MQASLLEILELMFALPLAWAFIYLIRNRKNALDIYNRIARRSRCVHVTFRTRAKYAIDRFLVPDQHGMMDIEGGVYHYLQEFAVWNPKHRMYSISFIEGQIEPEPGLLVRAMVRVPVERKNEATGLLEMKEEEVPSYIVDLANVHPKLVEIEVPETRINADGKMQTIMVTKRKTAKALHEFKQQKVATDIVEASSPAFQRLQTIMIICMVTCGLLVLGGYLFYQKLGTLQNQIDILASAVQHLQGTGVHAGA